MSIPFDMDTMPRDPYAAAAEFGNGMVSGGWTAERAANELASTLMVVLCDTEDVREDFEAIAEKADGSLMHPRQELFRPMVRLATRGILLREESDEEPILPSTIDLEQLVRNSSEGILWESEEGAAHRDSLSKKTGGILHSLVTGMHEGGLPKRQAKAIVREEIEDVANEVATRVPSYAALHFVIVTDMILHRAHLNTPMAFARTIKRVAGGYKSK